VNARNNNSLLSFSTVPLNSSIVKPQALQKWCHESSLEVLPSWQPVSWRTLDEGCKAGGGVGVAVHLLLLLPCMPSLSLLLPCSPLSTHGTILCYSFAFFYTPNYLGGWDQEDCGSRPAQAMLRAPVSKISRAKWNGGVAQVVECLLCKLRSPMFKPQSHQKMGMATFQKCLPPPHRSGVGFELRASCLLGRYFSTWAAPFLMQCNLLRVPLGHLPFLLLNSGFNKWVSVYLTLSHERHVGFQFGLTQIRPLFTRFSGINNSGCTWWVRSEWTLPRSISGSRLVLVGQVVILHVPGGSPCVFVYLSAPSVVFVFAALTFPLGLLL
jgi:hypothetical protein